jgi:hypothetical protein
VPVKIFVPFALFKIYDLLSRHANLIKCPSDVSHVVTEGLAVGYNGDGKLFIFV